MDPVHYRGTMGPVHISGHGPTPKWRIHGPGTMFCPHPLSGIEKAANAPQWGLNTVEPP